MSKNIQINFNPEEFTNEELNELVDSLDSIGLHADAQEIETYILNKKSIKDDPELDFET